MESCSGCLLSRLLQRHTAGNAELIILVRQDTAKGVSASRQREGLRFREIEGSMFAGLSVSVHWEWQTFAAVGPVQSGWLIWGFVQGHQTQIYLSAQNRFQWHQQWWCGPSPSTLSRCYPTSPTLPPAALVPCSPEKVPLHQPELVFSTKKGSEQ